MRAIEGYFKLKSLLAVHERNLCRGYLKQYIKKGLITAKDAVTTWKLYGFTSWDLF